MPIKLRANILGEGFCRIVCDGGLIAEVARMAPERAGEPYCSPGFVDLQINGLAGVDFSAPDLAPSMAASVLPKLWSTGVTTFCPTLVTSPLGLLERNLRVLETARKEYLDFAASAPCYHLEGPYLSPGPAHGAHLPSLMRRPSWDEFARLQEAAAGHIGILTVAPELPGAIDLIRRATASGVVVGIGHTDGESRDIHEAVQAGARLSTHLGNGCPEFIHRHRSPIWAQLVCDELFASLICDGFHLPTEVMQAIARVKGPDRSILVTDAIHVAGLAPGRFQFGSVPIELLPTGQVTTLTTPRSMAGSTLAMNRAVECYQSLGRVSIESAIRAASTNPARLLGEKYSVCRSLEAGSPANLTLWHQDGERLEIDAVFVNGNKREAAK